MDDNEMVARIREAFNTGDVEAFARAQHAMSAEDVVQEWPQSGERIRGRDNIAAVNQNYPASTGTTPKTTLRRVLKPGEAWIIESTIDYGDGVPVSLVSIIETGADGKVVRETDYFANPFEAPAWRAKWVEKMEPITVG
jgi:SnoaL-like protein